MRNLFNVPHHLWKVPYEIQGVIEDLKVSGYDETCGKTLLRVRQQLSGEAWKTPEVKLTLWVTECRLLMVRMFKESEEVIRSMIAQDLMARFDELNYIAARNPAEKADCADLLILKGPLHDHECKCTGCGTINKFSLYTLYSSDGKNPVPRESVTPKEAEDWKTYLKGTNHDYHNTCRCENCKVKNFFTYRELAQRVWLEMTGP